MAKDEPARIAEHRLPVAFRGKFPPDASGLSSLGFDSVSVSKGAVIVRKGQGVDFAGKPLLFFEIELGKNCAVLRYSVGGGSDERLRRLHATTLFLRVLSLFPGALQADAAQLSSLALPPLEASAQVADSGYEMLAKRHSDLKADFSELSKKSRRLANAAEEGARSSIELERQIAALSERILKLEAVSDQVLREMVADWLSSHRGSFDAASFSKANNVPPQRAEEGLWMLVKSGAARKVEGGYSVKKQEGRGVFELQKAGRFDASEGIAAIRKAIPFGKR